MLKKEEKLSLENEIQSFYTWIVGRLGPRNIRNYEFIEFCDPDDSDWFMSVSSSAVKFNTHALKSCTYEYYRMIVLHECFHLLVQNVPNKLDAKRVKDDFGAAMMVLLDIEADFYTYLFHKDILGFNLVEIFLLNYQGGKVFGDELIRFPKFERFIGSVLSITNNYVNNDAGERDIFLVSTKNLPTDESIHAIVLRNTHFFQQTIMVGQKDIENMTRCYKREDSLNAKDYADRIISFSCKALSHEVPVNVEQELKALGGDENV